MHNQENARRDKNECGRCCHNHIDVGHLKNMCREKSPIYKWPISYVKKIHESDYYNPFVVDTVKQVCIATVPNDSQCVVNLSLERLTVPLKLNTGSDVNILPNFKLKREPEIKPTKIKMTSYTGDIIPITRKIYTAINRKGKLHELCFIVTPRKVQTKLGKDTCKKLNVIKRVNFIQNHDKNNILSAFKELFTRIADKRK